MTNREYLEIYEFTAYCAVNFGNWLRVNYDSTTSEHFWCRKSKFNIRDEFSTDYLYVVWLDTEFVGEEGEKREVNEEEVVDFTNYLHQKFLPTLGNNGSLKWVKQNGILQRYTVREIYQIWANSLQQKESFSRERVLRKHTKF